MGHSCILYKQFKKNIGKDLLNIANICPRTLQLFFAAVFKHNPCRCNIPVASFFWG